MSRSPIRIPRLPGESREDHFWRQTDKTGDCWLWLGGCLSPARGGYGRFYYLGETSAHRVAWRLVHDRQSIPDGLFVIHSCDNPPCVRPGHLRLGTVQDNSDDMVVRGRSMAGIPFTPEHAARISESLRRPEVRAKLSAASARRRPGARHPLSEQHRRNIGIAIARALTNPEVKAKLSLAAIRRWTRLGEGQRHGALVRELWKNDEFRAHASEVRRELWKDPDYRARQSESRRAAWARRKTEAAI